MNKLRFSLILQIFVLLFIAQLIWFSAFMAASPSRDLQSVSSGKQESISSVDGGNSLPDAEEGHSGETGTVLEQRNATPQSPYGSYLSSLWFWKMIAIQVAIALLLVLACYYLFFSKFFSSLARVSEQMEWLRSGKLDCVDTLESNSRLKDFVEGFNRMSRAIVTRENAMGQFAYLDSLTSLPNHNGCLKELERRLSTNPQSLCVTKVTVKDFADINANLGRETGDLIIMEVARWLQMIAGQGNLFHHSGSTFVILEDDISIEDAPAHMKSLVGYMSKEYQFQDISLYI